MSTLTWQTAAGSIGSFLHLTAFTKNIIANNAVNYVLVNGNLPDGVTISSLGIISGTPQLDNIDSSKPIYVFEFTVRAYDSLNNFQDRTFSLSVIFNLYIPTDLYQNRIRYDQTTLQYYISRGQVDSSQNITWKLDQGAIPINFNVSANGSITSSIGQNILPLKFEQFTNNENLQISWNSWLKEFLSETKEYDFQFSVVLNNPNQASKQSYTVRIIFTKISADATWFASNPTVELDTNQYYFFFAISEQQYINWTTDSNLGSIINGSVSELAVIATNNVNSNMVYSLKPFYNSVMPQGMILLDNGLLAGRISFKTHTDDPAAIPENDIYAFTVRANTTDSFNYSEQTFTIRVTKLYEQPYDNIWIRSFPRKTDRDQLKSIINNPVYFPEDLLYRKQDTWFGKTGIPLRFLFATGLNVSTVEQYYQAVEDNHYNKILTFSEVKTAVCLNPDLSIRYEVVYLEMQDSLSRFSLLTNQFQGFPDIVDIREFVANYYIKNNITYYIFKPNGLVNMNSRLQQVVGYYNSGIIPDWMTSFQFVDAEAGILRAPLGFVPAVVLAYTVPGGSVLIKYRLNKDRINFNVYQFEVDRYELDNNQQNLYSGNGYVTGSTTVFDNTQTVFEDGGTRFVENQELGFGGTLGSRYGDKYIKFPNIGAFS